MYRKFLLASVGAIALTGSAALAADLPSRAPPPVYLPPPPIFTWTGFYIGGQVGGAWGSGSGRFHAFDPDTNTFVDTSFGGNPSGVIGGGHVGFDYQIPGWNWFSSSGVVIGVEGTVDGTSLSRTTVVTFPGDFGGGTLSAHTSADIQGSIRGRLGIAWDRVLIYGTGGVAFAGVNSDVTLSGVDTKSCPSCPSSRQEAVRTPAPAGRSAAESNMPSPTIGRSEPSTASLISALSIGVLCFPRAVFSTRTVAWRKTRCRPGSPTSSKLTLRLRSSRNIKPHSSAPASTKTKPGLAAGFFAFIKVGGFEPEFGAARILFWLAGRKALILPRTSLRRAVW